MTAFAMRAALGFFLIGCTLTPVKAEEPVQAEEEELSSYEKFRYALGVSKYCEKAGHVTPDIAGKGRNIIGAVINVLHPNPTPQEIADGDAMEKSAEEDYSADPAYNAENAVLCQDSHSKFVEMASGFDLVGYELMRNQIGVMHYCREKGHITPAKAEQVIDSFRLIIALSVSKLSPETVASGDAAQKEGEAGEWGPPPRQDIAGMAPLTSGAEFCKSLSSGIGNVVQSFRERW